MPEALVPARLAFQEGTPYSEAYGDVYHSAAGGPAQARQVFLGGNALPARWNGRSRFVILETGFGLGLGLASATATGGASPELPSATRTRRLCP